MTAALAYLCVILSALLLYNVFGKQSIKSACNMLVNVLMLLALSAVYIGAFGMYLVAFPRELIAATLVIAFMFTLALATAIDMH